MSKLVKKLRYPITRGGHAFKSTSLSVLRSGNVDEIPVRGGNANVRPNGRAIISSAF
jgi:hypothetical protein